MSHEPECRWQQPIVANVPCDDCRRLRAAYQRGRESMPSFGAYWQRRTGHDKFCARNYPDNENCACECFVIEKIRQDERDAIAAARGGEQE